MTTCKQDPYRYSYRALQGAQCKTVCRPGPLKVKFLEKARERDLPSLEGFATESVAPTCRGRQRFYSTQRELLGISKLTCLLVCLREHMGHRPTKAEISG
jgi:hypothetical protein